jgi:DNA-binding beta-propeller fold protein YncE
MCDMLDKTFKATLLIVLAALLWITVGFREKGRYVFFRDSDNGQVTVCDSSTGNVFKMDAAGIVEIRTATARTILRPMVYDDRVQSK